MMAQLYDIPDILAVLCLPALLAVAVLLRRLRCRSQAASAAEARLRRQVGELRAAGAELERTSYTDPLTGVWNYRYLHLSLDREIARCLRNPHRPGAGPGGRFALLLLEIEGFDEIRRVHGRQRSGAVLRDLAQRLAMEFRQADVFGRYGGEEFLVLLPDTDAAGAEHAAERLRWTVRRHPLPLPAGAGNGLRAVVGVASLPRDGAHAALLLRAADDALARARAGGRTAPQAGVRAGESAGKSAGKSAEGSADGSADGSARPGADPAVRERPMSQQAHITLGNPCELPRKAQGQV
jgi:diguanylate cyclase (GGDEF)-like protein